VGDFTRIPANALSIAKRRPVLGVGINDSDYMAEIRVNGKRVVCPAYRAWKHILRRCYCKKFLSENPTYKGVSVCNEWLFFSGFMKWFDKNHKPGYQIDKDLLTDSKVYGPDSCIYVPRWLNDFTEDHGRARGEFKIGVTRHRDKGGLLSACSNPFGGPSYIGVFNDEEEAHKAWKSKKLEYALALKPKMDEIDERIYHRVVKIIERQS
jgi:hypothetical protein